MGRNAEGSTNPEKLVRDRIPEIIRSKGREPKTRSVRDSAELVELLQRKLEEEVGEFRASQDPEELADILEVLYALAGQLNLRPGDLEAQRATKAERRGGFKDGIVLSLAQPAHADAGAGT